jgi:hypothetical protein
MQQIIGVFLAIVVFPIVVFWLTRVFFVLKKNKAEAVSKHVHVNCWGIAMLFVVVIFSGLLLAFLTMTGAIFIAFNMKQ